MQLTLLSELKRREGQSIEKSTTQMRDEEKREKRDDTLTVLYLPVSTVHPKRDKWV